MKRRLIYALCDPITEEIRYIGKSSSGMRRAKYHTWHAKTLMQRGKRAPQHVYGWIFNLLRSGSEPEIIVLEDNLLDDDSLNENEMFYISYFKMIGSRLTNMTAGGEKTTAGIRYPESYRKKKSETMIQKLKDPSEKEKFDRFRAAGQTAEVRKRRSESVKRSWERRR